MSFKTIASPAFLLTGLILAGLAAGPAAAKVAADQAARLGQDLTPMGAEKAANADGSIPAWDGGVSQPPAGYKPGDHYVSPFAADKPLFTIDAGNMDSYKTRLTDGQMLMMKLYPDYKLTVYPSRRSCAAPSRVYEANKKNALTATMTDDQNGLNNAILGNPFPIPQSGAEVIWNHRLRYRGFKFRRHFASAAVNRDGSYVLFKARDEGIFHYSGPGLVEQGDVTDIAQLNNIGISYINVTTAPVRLAGSIVLVHDTINALQTERQSWQYLPATRRVLVAPEIAYDTPLYNTDGLATTDQFDMYNGATDRYDFKLMGKREIYVAYNAYDLASDKHSYKEILQSSHLNQALNRYELHRVWVVEATLKPNERHLYGKRVFYVDEDSWNIVAVDLYDRRGQLWRVQEGPLINYFEVPLCSSALEVTYDTQSGRYVVFGMKNEEKMIDWNATDVDAKRFTSTAIQRMGVR